MKIQYHDLREYFMALLQKSGLFLEINSQSHIPTSFLSEKAPNGNYIYQRLKTDKSKLYTEIDKIIEP